jgi:hypothetical protein
MRPHWTWRPPGQRADFYVAYTRGRCDERWPTAPVVARVERLGSTLAVVKDLRAVRRDTVTRLETDLAEPD